MMKCPKCGSSKFYALPCVSVGINSSGRIIHKAKYINDCDTIDLIVCEECDYTIENEELEEFVNDVRSKQSKNKRPNSFWD